MEKEKKKKTHPKLRLNGEIRVVLGIVFPTPFFHKVKKNQSKIGYNTMKDTRSKTFLICFQHSSIFRSHF